MYAFHSKLVPVQANKETDHYKEKTYYVICLFSINYESVMFYRQVPIYFCEKNIRNKFVRSLPNFIDILYV